MPNAPTHDDRQSNALEKIAKELQLIRTALQQLVLKTK